MPKLTIRECALAGMILLVAGCAGQTHSDLEQEAGHKSESKPDNKLESENLDARFKEILANHKMATAGAAIIQNGEIVWTGYYGDQVPGVPASRETLFNVGSIAKTITAETVLRLASEGALPLDEPMAPHWVDPDLVDDPRHEDLIARMALSHRTGLPNWRYSDPEFKLRFVRDPGASFGYSGEGYEYVAKYAQSFLKTPFDVLAEERVISPLGLKAMSLGPKEWVLEKIAHPVDEEGARHTPFCTDAAEWRCAPIGEWSAADELATTVEDYAHFLIAVMNGEGVNAEFQKDRLTIQTSTADDDVLRCALADQTQCPRAQGYGLGWEIFEFDDAKIVSHGGSDWSERAMAYFDVNTHNGIVVFFNGPASTSTDALIDGMNALDPGSKLAMLYEGWVAAYEAKQEAAEAE